MEKESETRRKCQNKINKNTQECQKPFLKRNSRKLERNRNDLIKSIKFISKYITK